jgi:CubicO group peptidase (beta-lactamase class C family)
MNVKTIEVHGSVAPGYEGVREAFARNLETGLEVGATFAVYRNGESLVDLWGGHADAAGTTPVDDKTLFTVWSTTKGVAAACVALLVDRGKLDYEVPVARYWPEFAAAGKDRITVGQMLSHQAGLVGAREPVTLEDFYEHDRLVGLLAAQEPFFAPGKWGYHTLTYGSLADELIRRVDGRRIGRFFAEEFAEKLDLDIYLGLPESKDHRQSEMIVPADIAACAFDAPNQATLEAAMLNPMLEWSWPNRRDWRAAGLAGAGGSANGRSLARLYDFFANEGTAAGIPLISPETVRAASVERVAGVDQSSGMYGRYGAGFRINTGTMGSNPEAFGHAGLGGSVGFADPSRKIGVGYAMNKLMNTDWGMFDPRLLNLLAAFYSV